MENNIISPYIIGIQSTKLLPIEREVFQKLNPIGFILYSRNISKDIELSLFQRENILKDLTFELKSLFPFRKIQIWIDEEGGLVSRLTSSNLVPKDYFKPSKYFYELYKEKGLEHSKKAVYDQYILIATKLLEYGITGTFAPVADLYYEGKSSVISTRSFGPEVNIVIEFCKMAILALKSMNVDSCIKHIPGHGLAETDSHYELPIVNKDLEYLMENDFKIFKELAELVEYGMTAHIIYKCLDEKKPITLSKKGISFIRNQLGFKKTKIITDSIEMNALFKANGWEQTDNVFEYILNIKQQCLDSGCDIILYCHPDKDKLIELLKN